MLIVEFLDGKKHDRIGFDCGDPILNDYLSKKANQDIKDKYAQVYVIAEDKRDNELKGYLWVFYIERPHFNYCYN